MPTAISPKFKITNSAGLVRAGNWDGGTTKTLTQNTMGSNQTLHFAPGIWTPGDTLSLTYYQTKPGAGMYWGWQSGGQAMAWPLQNPDTDWQTVGHGWRYFSDRSGTGYAGNYKTGDGVLSLPASNEYLSAVTSSLFFRGLYVAHPSGSSQATKSFSATKLPHDDTVALGDDKPFYIKCMVIQMLDPISGDYIKDTMMSVDSAGNISNTVPRYDAKTLRYAGDPSGDRRLQNWSINKKSYRHLPFQMLVVVANPNYKSKTFIYPAHGSKTYTVAANSAQGARDTSPVMSAIDPDIPSRMNSFFTTGQSLETRNPTGWSGSPVWEVGDTPEFRMRFPKPWRNPNTVGEFSTTGPFAKLSAVERPKPTLVVRGIDQTPNDNVTTNNISVFEGIEKSAVLAFNNSNYLIELAEDFDGTDLKAQVANNFSAIVNGIDFNVPGQHTITWTATDSYGLSSTIQQTLEVFEKPRQKKVPSGGPINCEDLNMNQNRWLELDEPWLAVSRFQKQTLSYNQARNFYARSTFIPGDTYDRWYGTGSLHFPGFTRDNTNVGDGAITNTVNVRLSDFIDRYNITIITKVKPESKNTYYTSGDAGVRMQVVGPEDVTVDITVNDDKRTNVGTEVAEWVNLGLTTDELRATGIAGLKKGMTNYPVKIELHDTNGKTTTLDHIWIQLGQAGDEFTSLYARHTWWPVKLTPEFISSDAATAEKQGAYIQPTDGSWTHDPSTDPSCDSNEYMIWGSDTFLNPSNNKNYTWLMHGFMQNYGIWSPLGCYHPTERKFLPEPKYGYQKSMPVEKGDGDSIDENTDMFVYTDHAALKPDTKYNIMFAGLDHSGFFMYDNLKTRIELYAPDQYGGYEDEPFEVLYPSLKILDDDFDTIGESSVGSMQSNWYFDGLQAKTYHLEKTGWGTSRNFNKDGFYQVNHERSGVVGDTTENSATRTRSAQHYNYDGTEVNENSLWAIGGTFEDQDGGWSDFNEQTTFTTPPARIRKNEQYMAYKVVIKARGLRDIKKDTYSNTYLQMPGATYSNALPKAIAAVIYQKDKHDPLAFPHGHRIETLSDGKKLARSIYFGHARNGADDQNGQYRDLQHVLGPNIAWTTRDHCYSTTELQRMDKNRYRPDEGAQTTGDITKPTDSMWATPADGPISGEGHYKAFDNNSSSKYLNFKANEPGVIVSTTGGVVTGITLTSANDHVGRDPASYKLFGSTDRGVTWNLISSGSIPNFSGRNVKQQIDFTNSSWYNYFKIVFPTIRDTQTYGEMQIAEIELLGPTGLLSPEIARSGVIPSTNGAEFEWSDGSVTVEETIEVDGVPTIGSSGVRMLKTTTAKGDWSWPIIDVVFGDIVNLQIDGDGNIINDGTIYTGD